MVQYGLAITHIFMTVKKARYGPSCQIHYIIYFPQLSFPLFTQGQFCWTLLSYMCLHNAQGYTVMQFLLQYLADICLTSCVTAPTLVRVHPVKMCLFCFISFLTTASNEYMWSVFYCHWCVQLHLCHWIDSEVYEENVLWVYVCMGPEKNPTII